MVCLRCHRISDSTQLPIAALFVAGGDVFASSHPRAWSDLLKQHSASTDRTHEVGHGWRPALLPAFSAHM